MANTRSANVWVLDTGATILGSYHVQSIKLVGTSGAISFTLSKGSNQIYEASLSNGGANYDHGLPIYLPTGFTFTISGTGAKAYLYLSDETC